MSEISSDIAEQRRLYDSFYGEGGFSKLDPAEEGQWYKHSYIVTKNSVLISQDWFNEWLSYIGRSRSDQSAKYLLNGCQPGPLDFSRIMSSFLSFIYCALR